MCIYICVYICIYIGIYSTEIIFVRPFFWPRRAQSKGSTRSDSHSAPFFHWDFPMPITLTSRIVTVNTRMILEVNTGLVSNVSQYIPMSMPFFVTHLVWAVYRVHGFSRFEWLLYGFVWTWGKPQNDPIEGENDD